MRKVKVYIASPYSDGNREQNAQLQMEAAYHLLKLGFNPYAPLWNHFIQVNHNDLNEEFEWLELDKSWLGTCDMMVRLHPVENGVKLKSKGADVEEEYANELSIPVIHCEGNIMNSLIEQMTLFDTQVE